MDLESSDLSDATPVEYNVDCVISRATNVWKLGKHCGLVFPDTDEKAIGACVKHLKSSKSERYGDG